MTCSLLPGLALRDARGSSGERAGRSALGAGRLQPCCPAGPQGQEGHAGHASDHRRRDARPATAAKGQEPKSPFVFTSERGSPFTTAGFARLVERAGESAGLGFKAHPHMLRHAWYAAAQHDADRAGRGMWRNGNSVRLLGRCQRPPLMKCLAPLSAVTADL